ncbi:MAG: ATP-binding cassette domain-containing protein [Burkholderiales bacterium]|nr:ATP-binding cassette domain-containing protein [Burkholderiales bacterium]
MRVELEGVHARHPAAVATAAAALRGITLSAQPGEALAVVGPSGAGKTTLLQLLACALPPQRGELRVDGQQPWALSRRVLQRLRGQLCLVPQVPPLPPRQRVVTSVLAGRLPAMSLAQSIASLFYPADIPAAHEALARLDLADKLFERVDRLSGGERQRVALARALVSPARLWLLDEPISALDPTRAQQALQVTLDEARKHGATVVASLHQVELALQHFPRIVGLREGVLAFDLPRAELTPARLARLYAQHEHELQGSETAAEPAAAPPAPAPAVMHCR